MDLIEVGTMTISDKQLEPNDDTSYSIPIRNKSTSLALQISIRAIHLVDEKKFDSYGITVHTGPIINVQPGASDFIRGGITTKLVGSGVNHNFPEEAFQFSVKLAFKFLPPPDFTTGPMTFTVVDD